MRQIVGADGEEIDAREELVEHLGKARHFEHRAIFDPARELAMAFARPFDLCLEQGARFLIFPGL